jgi:hypothetical protein
MPSGPVRRFNTVDAMVLVAAMALAFAFVQFQGLIGILREKWFQPNDGILRPPEDGDMPALISSFLIPWTVALLVLRLRRPRPSRRRLLAQPGFAACAFALGTMVMIALDEYWLGVYAYRELVAFNIQNIVALNYRISVSFAPAGLWALMGACGIWRAEPSWIDRAGRALGVLWILLMLYRWY